MVEAALAAAGSAGRARKSASTTTSSRPPVTRRSEIMTETQENQPNAVSLSRSSPTRRQAPRLPGLDQAELQLLHPGQAQADPLRGRHRRGPARPAALPGPGLALRLLRRPRRLPAGLDGAEGLGLGPARARALPRLGRQGLRLAGPRLARVPRPERGVGAHPLPLQRQRRPAAQPEHRRGPAGQGLRAVEPELGALRRVARRRVDARRPRPRPVPVRQRQPARARPTCTTTRSR